MSERGQQIFFFLSTHYIDTGSRSLFFCAFVLCVCVLPTRESILGRRARKFDSFTANVLYICIHAEGQHAEGQNENKHSSFNGFVSSRSVGMYMYVKMNMPLAVCIHLYMKSCLCIQDT